MIYSKIAIVGESCLSDNDCVVGANLKCILPTRRELIQFEVEDNHARRSLQPQIYGTCQTSINCVGSFGAFTTCSVECGGGTQTHTFTITQPAANK